MKLSNATQNDVMDEYARELCGEYQRWVLMKRHKDSFKHVLLLVILVQLKILMKTSIICVRFLLTS